LARRCTVVPAPPPGGARGACPGVFALGPLTLEQDQVAGSRKQLGKALTRLGVYPQFVTVFGGVVDPEKLPFPFNRMAQSDARDWSEIEAWTSEVVGHFADYFQRESV
jgi:menaquinone-dependent protoporphyrinogen IX oxidase